MKKISVILSVYNSEKYLKPAIVSILNQTFKDFEFLIIDDASTDNSGKITKKFAAKDKRIMLINNKKRLGLTKSLNKAIRLAQGKYIARMDADDISLPDRLKKQTDFLDKNKEIAFCGTAIIYINEKGERLKKDVYPLDYPALKEAVLHFCPFKHPTLIFRKNILLKENGYNEDFQFAQDYELVLRLLQKYKGANLKEPLLLYRIGDNKSISVKNLKKQEWLALKARWLALTKYGYPKIDFWKLIKPALSFLLPVSVKIWIYKRFFWK